MGPLPCLQRPASMVEGMKRMEGNRRRVGLLSICSFPVLSALAVALGIVLGLYALEHAGAQAQPARTIGVVRILADQFVDGPAGSGIFTATGNLKLAFQSGPPVMTIGGSDARIVRQVSGGPVRVFGAPKFISDTRPITANVATKPLTSTSNPTGFILDTNTGELQGSDETLGGTIRNDQYVMAFLEYFGLDEMYRQLDDQALSRISFRYELDKPNFKADLLVDLSVRDNDENPPTTVGVHVTIDSRGQLSGSVDSLSLRYGGLVLSIEGARVVSGGFSADTAKVLLAQNPNFPKLDPTAPSGVSFQINGIEYRAGTLSARGGTVGLPTLHFANAFSVTNASASFVNDPIRRRASTIITGSVRFGGVVTRSAALTASLRFTSDGPPNSSNRTTILTGTLSDVVLNAGIVRFDLKQLAFTGSTAGGSNSFWGIDANDARLRFPESLSPNAGAQLTDFRVGMNPSGELSVFLGGLSAATPPIASGVLSGTTASANFATVDNHLVLTFTIGLSLKLAGGATEAITQTTLFNPELKLVAQSGPRARASCTPSQGAQGCRVAFRGTIERFAFNAAGFRIDVKQPRLRTDGGFETSTAAIAAPFGAGQVPGVGAGELTVSVQNLVMTGAGQLTIAGGEFSLPPLEFGDISFPTLRGSFKSVTVGGKPGFRLEARGKLVLPGLESGPQSIGLDVSIVVQTLANGKFDEAGVSIAFFVPAAALGIPIGSSGLAIVGMSGSFEIADATTSTPDIVFSAGITIQSIDGFTIPGTSFSAALVTIQGNVTVDTKPFSIVAETVVKFLIFQMARAEVALGMGQGIGSGFGARFTFEKFDLFIWPVPFVVIPYNVEGTVRVGSRNGDFKVNGTGRIGVEIPEGLAGPGLPPFPLSLAELSGSFGEFNIPGRADTVGALTTYRHIVRDFFGNPHVLFSLSMFFDFKRAPDSGQFFKFVDPDDYRLRSSLEIAEEALRSQGRFAFRDLGPMEGGRGTLVAASAPFTITAQGTALFGISYPGTTPVTPTITLTTPSGVTLTQATVNQTTQFYLETAASTITGSSSIFFAINNAAPGIYQLSIDGAPSDFTSWSYVLNNAPTVTGTTATRSGNQVTLTWTAQDSDSPSATVRVGFAPVLNGNVDLSATRFLSENLPLGPGTFVWNLIDAPSGTYRLVVEANDGKNQPQVGVADLDIDVVDTTPPATPSGLAVDPLPGMVTLRWAANTELDIAGYEVGFALTPDFNAFLYTRNVGPRDTSATTTETGARIWGLEDNQTVYFSVRAYDMDGHYSPWAPFVAGSPWPLSPRNISPTPAMTGTPPVVAVSFNTPLDRDRLPSILSVTTDDGSPLPGELEVIEDLETGDAIGLLFRASISDRVAARATILGGANGVRAADGRTMPTNYSWSFTLEPAKTFVPNTALRVTGQ
ncbi:MAG: hypothetical protein KatS3mg060_2003 [Dehalococcoidia bacterium]|nr:MAG: hypothetical protein KatS3mg060_2003 [Dehalococcoidia bacterium]